MYYDYVEELGNAYERPDLAIAFNSGCGYSLEVATSWAATIRLLVERKIPTVFTVRQTLLALYSTD